MYWTNFILYEWLYCPEVGDRSGVLEVCWSSPTGEVLPVSVTLIKTAFVRVIKNMNCYYKHFTRVVSQINITFKQYCLGIIVVIQF